MRVSGALLVNKHAGVSSFGVIEMLQRHCMENLGLKRRDVPKFGHGGTLDPFATGLLFICVGNGVKLARYFLGSSKGYEGLLRFGETTVPGDPTSPVSERSERVPSSREELQELASKMMLQPYLQTPPMHSAKKKDGKPLYELARKGIEVDREAKLCHLYNFSFQEYSPPRARFSVVCSSGTYVRTLAQDFARLLGTVGMLDALHRSSSGSFACKDAWGVEAIIQATASSGARFDELPCWIPFDRMLASFPSAAASPEERDALFQGRQGVLFNILGRTQPSQDHSHRDGDRVAIYSGTTLIAVAAREQGVWGLERVFSEG